MPTLLISEAGAGVDLDHRLGLLVADLPPVVTGADRDLGGLAGAEHPLAAVDEETDLAGKEMEALGERGVVVLGRHAPARLHVTGGRPAPARGARRDPLRITARSPVTGLSNTWPRRDMTSMRSQRPPAPRSAEVLDQARGVPVRPGLVGGDSAA